MTPQDDTSDLSSTSDQFESWPGRPLDWSNFMLFLSPLRNMSEWAINFFPSSLFTDSLIDVIQPGLLAASLNTQCANIAAFPCAQNSRTDFRTSLLLVLKVTKCWNICTKIGDHDRSKSRTSNFTNIETILFCVFFKRWFSRDPFFYPTHQSRVEFRCSWLIRKDKPATNIRNLNTPVHFLCKTSIWLQWLDILAIKIQNYSKKKEIFNLHLE